MHIKNYRPEIDGLRCLAIVTILLFHADFKIFSGGYVGVDIFFVISGYLITGIILNEINDNKFSLIHFYERRARRILPNLLFIIILSTLFSWLFLNIYDLQSFGKSLLSVATFSSNFYFWLKSGYFSESTELIPLIHTWSLSVEEQFYLFFPILMIYLSKLNNKKLFLVIFYLTFCSLFLSIWVANYVNPIHQKFISSAFYLLPTRAWELGVGAIIAINIIEKRIIINFSIREVFFIEISGISLILISVFFFTKGTPFPGLASIIPVIGTGIIILFSNNNTIIGKFLANKFLVFIGLLSYSLYLWHQVVFSFWRNTHLNKSLDGITKFLLLLVSFALSYFSYKYIEKPFRNKMFLTQRQILLYSIISFLIVLFLGFITLYASKDEEAFSAKKLSISKYIYFQNMDERKFTQYRLVYEQEKVDVIVMGSSRLMQLGANSFRKPTLNLSVSGASVEDYVAFIPESVSKFKASVVYMGADPWLFNKNSEQTRWTSVINMYSFWQKKILDCNHESGLFLDFNNYKVNENWLNSIYSNYNFLNHVQIDSVPEHITKKSKDGLIIYENKFGNKSLSEIKKQFPNDLSYSMNNYDFDYKARNTYINLIKYLKEKNIEVILVLSPYHPELLELMRTQEPRFIKIENDFKEIAHNLNIKIIGSYDVSKISKKFGGKDFYDGIHPKDSIMNFIVKQNILKVK
jgi:peptidoglycan/LPS O-acetylase OafA/YrhL